MRVALTDLNGKELDIHFLPNLSNITQRIYAEKSQRFEKYYATTDHTKLRLDCVSEGELGVIIVAL